MLNEVSLSGKHNARFLKQHRVKQTGPVDPKPKNNAQVGIRIRVVCVTGKHDGPLHYLGSLLLNKCPASRIRTGDIAVAAQLPKPVNHTTAAHSTELS